MDTMMQIELDYVKREHDFPEITIDQYTEEAKIYAKYILETLPQTDVTLTQTILDDYVSQAKRMRHVYGDEISLGMYCEYVVQPKVNNEPLDPSRVFFSDLMKDMINPDSIRETVLAINTWIIGVVQYRTTDARTKNAMHTYLSGTGRCGEKSTLMVQLCRSVGICARQIYAPWWSHSDDRHAWVEVYINDQWQFLGAGDSEVDLNRGWFKEAANRALIVQSNHFSNLKFDEPVLDDTYGMFKRLNITSHYTKTREIKIHHELDNVDVLSFEVINYGAYRSLFKRKALKDVEITIEIGYGDFVVRAVEGNSVYLAFVHDDMDEVVLTYQDRLDGMKKVIQNVKNAKVDNGDVGEEVRKKIAETKKKKLKQYHERMKEIDKYPVNQKEMDVLVEAVGKERACQVMGLLSVKDRQDFKAEVLINHIRVVEKYEDQFQKGDFESFILNPRVSYESLNFDAKKLENLGLDTQEKIETFVDEFDDHIVIPDTTTPFMTMVDKKKATPYEKTLLKTILMRIAGIPVFYNTETSEIYRWVDSELKPITNRDYYTLSVTGDDDATLTIKNINSPNPMSPMPIEGDVREVSLANGVYEIVLSRRLPNGKVIAAITVVRLETDLGIELILPTIDESMLIEGIDITDLLNEMSLVTESGILIIGDINEEPTQHTINELLEWNRNIRVSVFDEDEHHRLYKILGHRNQGYKYHPMNTDWANRLARRCFKEPGLRPLVVFYKNGKTLISNCGYLVGFMKHEWVYKKMGESA